MPRRTWRARPCIGRAEGLSAVTSTSDAVRAIARPLYVAAKAVVLHASTVLLVAIPVHAPLRDLVFRPTSTFMENPDRPCHRQRLLCHVWPPPFALSLLATQGLSVTDLGSLVFTASAAGAALPWRVSFRLRAFNPVEALISASPLNAEASET